MTGMSSTNLIRGASCAVFAGAIFWRLMDHLTALEPEKRNGPLVDTMIFPVLLLLLPLMFAAAGNWPQAAAAAMDCTLGMAVPISVYFALLLAALPLLRRRFSARLCALLWLLPAILYVTQYSFMKSAAPRAVVYLPDGAFPAGTWVWAAGFCAVLAWRTAEHLRYRHALLAQARPVTEPWVLALWDLEQGTVGVRRRELQLVRSAAAAMPLSIGLSRKTTRVVLPERTYTRQELTWIFRHELTHICRGDAQGKFFLTFCTALCWWNPLMWLAMGRCAEDLELSCDEAVLEEAEAADRRAYAELLLSSAGDGRGYTTCLSASARSLRYRLRRILHPGRRLFGGFLAALLAFSLLYGSSAVSFAYERGTGRDWLFDGTPEAAVLSERRYIWDSNRDGRGEDLYVCTDPAALIDHLAGLTLYRYTGQYDLSDGGREWEVACTVDGRYRSITFGEGFLQIMTVGEGNRPITRSFRLAAPPDWAYLESLTERA